MAAGLSACADRMTMPRRGAGLCSCAWATLLLTSPLLAQPPSNAPAPPAAAPAEGGESTAAQEGKRKKVDLLIAPVPLSNPATGTGLAVGAIAFYNPNAEPAQWISGGGVVYTTRGTKGIAGFHSMSFGQDRVRVNASLSYLDDRTNYYGIGRDAGDEGDRLELKSRQFDIDLQGLIRLFPDGYAGLRYRFRATDAVPQEPDGAPPTPPEDQMHSSMSALGPSFVYDTRDSPMQPKRGIYVSASWLFGLKALGDSYHHNKLQLAGNAYMPIGSGTVLATRGALCAAGGDVPYYDLCQFGATNDLRGYPTGRYRDGASWAVQAELRQHIAGRWGATGFVGLGGIAPSSGNIWSRGNLLPAAGAGVRYRPFRSNDVQLRVDFAVGKNDHGAYVGIAEAF